MPSPSKIGPKLQTLVNGPPPTAPWVDVNIQLDLEPASLFATFPDAKRLAQPERSIAIQRIAAAILLYQKNLLTAIADITQGEPRSLWINNVVGAKVLLSRVDFIANRNDVRYIEVSSKIPLFRVLDHKPGSKRKATKAKSTLKKSKQPKKTSVIVTSRTTRRPVRSRRIASTLQEEHINIIPVDDKPVDNKPAEPTGEKTNYSRVIIDDNIKLIGADSLWEPEFGLTGKGILVAVIDTGIKDDHSHVVDRMWDDGTIKHGHGINTILNNTDTMDYHGHGTACAGIIAGKCTGVAREATLVAIKALDADDPAALMTDQLEQHIWAGMEFALTIGCHVISMSVSIKNGDHPHYPAWRSACDTLYAAGIMHVNSSGKHGTYAWKLDDVTHLPTPAHIPNNIPAPANCPPPWLDDEQVVISAAGGLCAVIACGCCNNDKYLVNYSGRGPSAWDDYVYTAGAKSGLLKPDLTAPGVRVRSCDLAGGILPMYSGTSAATPHVAGAIALLMQACVNAGLTAMPLDHILEALSNTAMQLDGQAAYATLENGYGAGCINVYEAYKYGHSTVRGWW